MRLDCDKYRTNVQAFKGLLDDKTQEEREAYIGVLAISSGVPIIVVAHYVGELYGFTPTLTAFIQRLCKFYRVTEVIGVRRHPEAESEDT